MVLTKLVYLEQLYNTLKIDGLNNPFLKINTFFNTPSSSTWSTMNVSLNQYVTDNSSNENYISLRVLIIEADGTVAYDSSRITSTNTTQQNTYSNYQAKTINENHNSRPAVITALISNSGVGKEQRWSSTNGTFQQYLAIRMGLNNEFAIGVIRISIV